MFDTFNYEILKISFTSVRHQYHYVNLSQNCSPIITDWVFKKKNIQFMIRFVTDKK